MNNYTPKGAVCKSEYIRVARLIMAVGNSDSQDESSGTASPRVAGDMDAARRLHNAQQQTSRTAAEARAIAGACRAASKAFGIWIDPYLKDYLK